MAKYLQKIFRYLLELRSFLNLDVWYCLSLRIFPSIPPKYLSNVFYVPSVIFEVLMRGRAGNELDRAHSFMKLYFLTRQMAESVFQALSGIKISAIQGGKNAEMTRTYSFSPSSKSLSQSVQNTDIFLNSFILGIMIYSTVHGIREYKPLLHPHTSPVSPQIPLPIYLSSMVSFLLKTRSQFLLPLGIGCFLTFF